MYSGGKVSIDIVPDTDGFRAQLNRFLRSLDDEFHVGVNADWGRFDAQVASKVRDRDMTVRIDTEGDWSGLDRYAARIQQSRKAWERASRLTPRVDMRPMLSQFATMGRQSATAARNAADHWKATFGRLAMPAPTGRMGASMDAIASRFDDLKAKSDEYQTVLDRNTAKQSALWAKRDRELAELAERENQLNRERMAAEQALADLTVRTNKRKGAWAAQTVQATKRLQAAQDALDTAQLAGDDAAIESARQRIATETARIKAYGENTAKAVKAQQDLQRETSRTTARIDRQLGKLAQTSTRVAASYERALKPLNTAMEKTLGRNRALLAQSVRDMRGILADAAANSRFEFEFGGAGFLTDLKRKASAAESEMARLDERQSAHAQAMKAIGDELSTTLDRQLAKYGQTADNAKADVAWGRTALRELNAKSAELTDHFDEQEQALEGIAKQLQDAKKYGVAISDTYGNIGERINDATRTLRNFRDYAAKHPAKAELKLDRTDWDRQFAEVLADAEQLGEQLDRQHRIDVRVKFWEDNANRIEDRLEQLRHERVDIPVDFQADQERIVRRMRQVAAQIKANPDRAFELEANLDVDMRQAEDRLDKLKRDNRRLQMDVDLETALARAHLAAFTRPRTIDIFANLKGTDFARLLNGMTSGAAGLKGVQNQFDRLVDTFDRLDETMPAIAKWGTIITSVVAGATNLAGSVGGAAASILSLGRAAYAAPAALGATAAGFYGLYAAVKTAGDHFDIATTQLGGLQEQVGAAFWDEAGDAIRRMSDTLGDDFVGNMRDVAVAEGQAAAAMADIVAQSQAAGRIPAMLDHADTAVRNLTPGLESAVTALTALGRTGGEYLPQFTNWVSQNLTWFATWAQQVEADNQRVKSAMDGVKEQAGYVGSAFMSLKGILEGTFGTLAQHENGLQGFSDTLAAMDDAANSARFQQTLDAWTRGAQQAQSTVRDALGGIGSDMYSLRDATRGAFTDAGRIVASTMRNLSQALATAGPGISDFTSGLADGWSRMMDTIGGSGSMLSDFASMAGSLSRTFGGTLASTLKSAAPILQTVASATRTVADAFNALPDSVKGAIGLWATFGKAGMQAVNTVKASMMQNISATLQYRSTLEKLGLSADKAKISILGLAKAQTALARGEVAGALSGQASAVRRIGDESETAARKMTAAKTSTSDMASAMTALEGLRPDLFATTNRELERTPGIITRVKSGFKTMGSTISTGYGKAIDTLSSAATKAIPAVTSAGTAIIDAFGGPAGAAIAAGVGVATMAISEYNQTVMDAQAASENMSQALSNVATAAQKAGQPLSEVAQAAKDSLSDTDGYFNGLTDAASAAKEYGYSLDALSTAATGSTAAYEQMRRKLQNTADTQNDAKDSAKLLLESYEDTRKAAIEDAKALAERNGYSREYVDHLLDEGEGLAQVGALTQTATQKTQNHADATRILNQMLSDESDARIRANAAGSQYQQTLSAMAATIGQVNDLAANGQRVWDATANSFDLTTEAGRLASDSLGTLATNANDYLQAMVDSGASIDQVNAKQASMRGEFVATAQQMTGNETAAKALADQYLATPTQIDTWFRVHMEEGRLQLLQYTSLIRDTFPEGKGEQMYKVMVQAITSGAVTDITQLQDWVDKLSSGKYEVAFSSNGKPVLLEVDQLEQKAHQLADGTWQLNLSAEDHASPAVENLKSTVESMGGAASDVDILLEAQDGASDKIQNAIALAKAFNLTDAQIDILANNEAGPEIERVKAELRASGLNDEQIQILIDALNHASPKLKEAEKDKDAVSNKPARFNIEADDTSARTKTAEWKGKDGQTLATAKAKVDGDDTDAQNKFNTVRGFDGMMLAIARALSTGDNTDAISKFLQVQGYMGMLLATAWAAVTGNIDDADAKFGVVRGWNGQTLADALGIVLGNNDDARAKFREVSAYDGMTIAQPWGRVLGDNGDARAKFQEVAWYNGQTISQPWGRVMGDNSDARAKFREVAAYNGATISKPWGRVMGDDSNVRSVFAAVQSQDGATLAITYVDVVTRKSEMEVKAATGGRISGPGSGTSDSIPAWLSNGEMVIKASSVRSLDAKYGQGFLNMLNSVGRVPSGMEPSGTERRWRDRVARYANGGRVAVPDVSLSVNPVVKVEMPQARAAERPVVNQTFHTKVVRSDQDLYSAASILYRNATREARVIPNV